MSDHTHAPIDPARLAPVLEADLDKALTLPAEAYTSETVLEWEREHFFEGSWVCAGRSDDLAQAGDQRAVRIGREGILLSVVTGRVIAQLLTGEPPMVEDLSAVRPDRFWSW